jgi:hypothetical protein
VECRTSGEAFGGLEKVGGALKSHCDNNRGIFESMATKVTQAAPPVAKEKAKALPFRYQFAAGAVAGISEVRQPD